MKFYINTESGSGLKYNTKEKFIKEIGLMIDDCIENGGTEFAAFVDADASCFYVPNDECPFGEDPSNDCTNCECGDDCHLVNGDCVER